MARIVKRKGLKVSSHVNLSDQQLLAQAAARAEAWQKRLAKQRAAGSASR